MKLADLYKIAPGAKPRRNAAKERLLDTTAWIEKAAEDGFFPVFAMQGSVHSDAEHDPKDGRHLVVVADKDGRARSLLNSHDRLMRVWTGAGYWCEGELLLSHVVPVQRWKGVAFAEDVKAEPWPPVRGDMARKIAEYVAKNGYIAGRGRPSAAALLATVDKGADVVLFVSQIVAAARRGNLEPSTAKNTRRNVKGVRRPDAYQHLALAAWKAMQLVTK